MVTEAAGGALALRPDQTDWTDAQKAALAQLGVAEAPRGDQLVFLHVSQRMGLDPFNKEIYMIGRWDPAAQKKKWTIQVGIDGFRSRSEEHPQFGGVGDAEWCGPDGQWKDVWISDEPPTAARFTVYRKDQPADKPTRAVALYREYVQTNSKHEPTQRWKTAPADQLAKCAEAKARRTAFPRQLGGVYAPEELAHLNNPQPSPVVIDGEVDAPAEPNWDSMVVKAIENRDLTELKRVYDLARGMKPNDRPLLNKIAAAKERITAEAPATNGAAPATVPATEPQAAETAPDASQEPAAQAQQRRLFALLRDGGVEGNQRALRLRIANRILNRPPADPITSFDQLSADDANTINECLQGHKDAGDLMHTLAELGANGNGNGDEAASGD